MDLPCPRSSRIAAVAAVLALGLGLTGCSQGQDATDPSASPTASAIAQPGLVDNLDGVTVEGPPGEEPTVTFEPFTIAETQSKVLTEGSGPQIAADGGALLSYVGVNGRTGEKFDSSFPSGGPVQFQLDSVVPGFAKGLTGKTEGSRVLIAMPGKDGYDVSGGNPQAGIEVGDTLVFVVDIVSVPLTGPQGDPVTQPAGQPQVTGAEDDPQVTIPAGDPPTELLVQPLVRGSGDPVSADSVITVHHRGWLWDGTQVEDSYASGAESGPLSTLIPGWVEGLDGQTVGSRVLLVVPPEQAFPDGVPQLGIPAGATLVYVVDILDAS